MNESKNVLPVPVTPGHPIVVALYVIQKFQNARMALLEDPRDILIDKFSYPMLTKLEIPTVTPEALLATATMLHRMWSGHLSIRGVQDQAWREWNTLTNPGSGWENFREKGRVQAEACMEAFKAAVQAWNWGWVSKPEYKKIRTPKQDKTEAFEVTDLTSDLALQCRYLGIIIQDKNTGKWAMSWNATFACKGEDKDRFRFNTREEAVTAMIKWHSPMGAK